MGSPAFRTESKGEGEQLVLAVLVAGGLARRSFAHTERAERSRPHVRTPQDCQREPGGRSLANALGARTLPPPIAGVASPVRGGATVDAKRISTPAFSQALAKPDIASRRLPRRCSWHAPWHPQVVTDDLGAAAIGVARTAAIAVAVARWRQGPTDRAALGERPVKASDPAGQLLERLTVLVGYSPPHRPPRPTRRPVLPMSSRSRRKRGWSAQGSDHEMTHVVVIGPTVRSRWKLSAVNSKAINQRWSQQVQRMSKLSKRCQK